jgi:hypothetical protein
MPEKVDAPITPRMLDVLQGLAKTPQGMAYLASRMQEKYPDFSAQIGDLASKLMDLEKVKRDDAERGHYQPMPPLDMQNGFMYLQQSILDSKGPMGLSVNLFFDVENKLSLSYELDQMTLKDWCNQAGKNPDEVMKAIDSYFWLFISQHGIGVHDDKLVKDGHDMSSEEFKALLNSDPSYVNNLKTFAKQQVDIKTIAQKPLDMENLPTKAVAEEMEKKALPQTKV